MNEPSSDRLSNEHSLKCLECVCVKCKKVQKVWNMWHNSNYFATVVRRLCKYELDWYAKILH